MDNSQLATLMLEWEATQRKADALAETIKAAVLAIGKTQAVGNVRATFSAGRSTFDYQAAVGNAIETGSISPADIEPWETLDIDYFAVVESAVAGGLLSGEYLDTYTRIKVDYAGAAKAFSLDAPVASQAEPSVTIKLAK